MNPIFTVGHSTHSVERFRDLLLSFSVETIYDVRSQPYSRFCPQFNRESLKTFLTATGIEYVFAGDELGARSSDPSCYTGDKVSFERLRETQAFKAGITKVVDASGKRKIALMCAERDPLECHRTILVCRNLAGLNSDIRHIHSDGTSERHGDAERRLLLTLRLECGLFDDPSEILSRAYAMQAEKIAYVRKPDLTREEQPRPW